MPQAINKNIKFTIQTNSRADKILFAKNKLLQIIGNLISNAMKFTPQDGRIIVELDMIKNHVDYTLQIIVSDTGVGLSKEGIEAILSGTAVSTNGTSGENGYGFRLALVKHLIDGLKGKLNIYSNASKGTTFQISLPQTR